MNALIAIESSVPAVFTKALKLAHDFAKAAKSVATQRAYSSDIAIFVGGAAAGGSIHYRRRPKWSARFSRAGAARLALDPATFGAHCDQTGHKSLEMLRVYCRDAELFNGRIWFTRCRLR
jgi:hypothetical protein